VTAEEAGEGGHPLARVSVEIGGNTPDGDFGVGRVTPRSHRLMVARSTPTRGAGRQCSRRTGDGPPPPSLLQIGVAAFCSIDAGCRLDEPLPAPSEFAGYVVDRRSFIMGSAALVAALATGSPARMRGMAENAAGRLQRDVAALDSTILTDPVRTARRASGLLMDAEVLLPLVPSLSLPIHRSAARAGLVAASCSRNIGAPFGALLGAAELHAKTAHDGPLLGEALLIRARHCGEAAHKFDVPSPPSARYLTRALEVCGGGREAAAVRATARLGLAWEYAAEGSETTAMRHIQMGAAEWGLSTGELSCSRGDVLRMLPGHAADAETSLYAALGANCPPVRTGAAFVALARIHLADGDVATAAEDLEEAYLANRTAGVRPWRVMAVRKLLPDCLATRELDVVMCEGGA
jgi:hypothetical protein